MSSLDVLTCPSCTASLEYDGRSETMRCAYCGTTIIVPESLKEPTATFGVMGDENPSQAAQIHEILRQIRAGKKIEAIKLYREAFGVGLKEAKEAVESIERGNPTAIMGPTVSVTTMSSAGTQSGGCGCSFLLFLGIIAFVGGIILFGFYTDSPEQFERLVENVSEGDVSQVLQDVSSELSNKAVLSDPIILNAVGDGIAPDLLLEVWQYGGEDIPVQLESTVLENGRRQAVWNTQIGVVGEGFYNVTVDDQLVYVTYDTTLTAYDRDTGEVDWETVLSDEVQNRCRACIRAQKDRVIVLTIDNTLEAFDTNTGRSVWKVRLESEYFSYPDTGQLAFTLIDDKVGIPDRVEVDGNFTVKLFFYDLETGEEVLQIEPLCADLDVFFDPADILHDSQLFVDEITGEMIVLFGTPAYVQQMCLQKWDVNAGEMVLEARVPAHISHGTYVPDGMTATTARSPFVATMPGALLATMEIEGENGSSQGITKFDSNTGEMLFEYADEDYQLGVIGQADNVILAWAKRERGSDQYEIWGLDEATGERLWSHILEAEYLYELDSFDDRFSYQLQPNSFVVLQLFADFDAPELLVEKLNPADGSLIYEERTILTDDSWRGLAWTNDYAYLSVSNVVAVDLETGETHIEWP